MDEIIIKSDDLLVMNLINYFITEENYKPMIIHGINDEIWLENLDNNYKIVRIVSHHIHNKEQLDFDKFKLSKIVKQVKRKTLSFKVKVLSIYTDIEDEKILNNDDVLITKEKDINNPKLVSAFPDIVEKTNRKEDGLEYFIKVTDNINKKNEKRNKIAEKIFSYKQPIVTYIIMAICIILFILMELSGGSTNSQTLLKYGANLDVLVKNGEYYRLFTCIFLHIGIMHLLCNMYSLYIIGREVENLFGKIKYIIIFILSGIFGSIMSLAFTHNTISAGASGAIFGLLGALLYFGMHYRTYLGEAIKRSIIPIIVINLIIGFFAEGIDLAAHIGGLVGGVLVAMMVGVPDKSKTKDIINGTILTIIYLIFISYLAFWR
ncbi:MAG: rhomboid family intramembrane serine protease [Bacilli bacterium]|nr:rhomboid family intramembrane serine protease [Clostridium sp.]MED9978806.1 rhomboid family intramembrane serine protease [Bacilli bacterium]